MQPPRLTITLPKPCSENWREMTPTEKGRFCASCQKQVIDFTTLTDKEVFKIFKESKNRPVCGQFFPSQLNRELVEVRKQNFFFTMLLKRIATSVLFFEAFVSTASAQTKKQGATQNVPADKSNKKTVMPVVISGHILDYRIEHPMSGMVVEVVEAKVKTETNERGSFKLVLSGDITTPYITLALSYTDGLKDTVVMSKEAKMEDAYVSRKVVVYRNPDYYLVPQDTTQTTWPIDPETVRGQGFVRQR